MSKKPSPHRRRSIAVLGHGQAKTSSRRRAYSIAPGERLSPSAKARRLLVSLVLFVVLQDFNYHFLLEDAYRRVHA